MRFEQGPIRPPSEAESLLVRLTRNCPWNRCVFCDVYKGKPFSRRSVNEIKEDVNAVRILADQLKNISYELGAGGSIDRRVLAVVNRSGDVPAMAAASWLFRGGKYVFLQDADTMIIKTTDLVEVIKYIKEAFPRVERVTSYARSRSILGKSPDELAEIRASGLDRIHLGLESGSDDVLGFMRKGVTAAQHIEAGRRVVEAGFSLCVYVILGLGGIRWAVEHPAETARVINSINPGYIRFRTLGVRGGTPLADMVAQGVFTQQGEVEMVREERSLIQKLDGITSRIVSDHTLNLLEEVEGSLPEDKQRMLAVIDRFLALPQDIKNNFIVGKRWGFYRRLDDLNDQQRFVRAESTLRMLEEGGNVEEGVAKARSLIL